METVSSVNSRQSASRRIHFGAGVSGGRGWLRENEDKEMVTITKVGMDSPHVR